MTDHTVKDVLLSFKVNSSIILESLTDVDFTFLCNYYRLEPDEKVVAYYHTGVFAPDLKNGTVLTSKRVVTAYDGAFEATIEDVTWQNLSLLIADAKPTLASGLKLPNELHLRTADAKGLKLVLAKLAPLLDSEKSLDLGINVELGEVTADDIKVASAFQKDLENFKKHKKRNILIIAALAALFFFKEFEPQRDVDLSSLRLPSDAEVVGVWYDDVGMPDSLNATFTIYESKNQTFLKRINGDGSVGTYKVSYKNGFYHLRNRAGSRYKPGFRGLELYDRAGYIRTASELDF